MTMIKLSKKKQLALLRQCAILFAMKKTSNESSIFEWLKICHFCHNLGFLYTGFSDDGKIDLVVIAYRIPKITSLTAKNIPKSESGKTLFVMSCASLSKSNLKALRLLRWYLRENPNVDTLAYNYRNSDKMKVWKLAKNEFCQSV